MALIIPEVFADAVNQNIENNLRVAKLATNYEGRVPEALEYGSVIHFPFYNDIGDASVVTKGNALTPAVLNMTDAAATVKQVGHSVRIFDIENKQVKGDTKTNMAEQLAYKLAKAVDVDLATSIKTDAVYSDDILISNFDQDALESAFEVFGDMVDDEDFAGILINSALRKYIKAMDGFTNNNVTYALNGNGAVSNGIIGYWNGDIPIIMSNHGTSYKITVSNSEKDAYMLALVKKDALGYVFQQSPKVEESRQALLLATDIVASELYATKVVKSNGVSLLNVYTA